MKTHTRRSKQRKAFTLIELLAVITILGILMATMSTVVPAALKKAAQNTSSNNLHNIIVTYTDLGDPIKSGGDIDKRTANDVPGFAEILARSKGLNDAALWYNSRDEISGEIPQSVLKSDANALKDAKPYAWDVVLDASNKYWREGRYPLIWTRGLGTEGKWDKEKSTWGDSGGHIGFGDGHVEWRENLKLKPLLKSDGTETSSYQEAIGTVAKVVKGDM